MFVLWWILCICLPIIFYYMNQIEYKNGNLLIYVNLLVWSSLSKVKQIEKLNILIGREFNDMFMQCILLFDKKDYENGAPLKKMWDLFW